MDRDFEVFTTTSPQSNLSIKLKVKNFKVFDSKDNWSQGFKIFGEFNFLTTVSMKLYINFVQEIK